MPLDSAAFEKAGETFMRAARSAGRQAVAAVMLGLCVRGRGGRDRTAAVAAPKSAFLWGSTPFLCARAKKWGGTGRGSAVYCLIKRRTRKRRK